MLSNVLSIAAIFISLASLGISARNMFHDRPRLKITSEFIEASEYGPEKILVTMINVGRRSVILRLFGGTDAAGHWGGTYLGNETGGIRLGEHERYEQVLEKENTILFSPDDNDLFYVILWVEDSLGIRHPVPNSREYIKKLWSDETT